MSLQGTSSSQGQAKHQQLALSWGRNADPGSSVLPAWKQTNPSPSFFPRSQLCSCVPTCCDKHRAAPGRSLPGAGGHVRAPGPGFPVFHKVSGSGGAAGTGTPVMEPLGMCLTCQLCSSYGLGGNSFIVRIRLKKTLIPQGWPDQRLTMKKIHNNSLIPPISCSIKTSHFPKSQRGLWINMFTYNKAVLQYQHLKMQVEGYQIQNI